MKERSNVGIGVGVARLSGGQVALLVMKGIVCCAHQIIPIGLQWPKRMHQFTVKFRCCVQFGPQIVKISGQWCLSEPPGIPSHMVNHA